jgi:hypothetical protein
VSATPATPRMSKSQPAVPSTERESLREKPVAVSDESVVTTLAQLRGIAENGSLIERVAWIRGAFDHVEVFGAPPPRRSRDWLKVALFEWAMCHQTVPRTSPAQRQCPACQHAAKRARSREAMREARAGRDSGRQGRNHTWRLPCRWPRRHEPAHAPVEGLN